MENILEVSNLNKTYSHFSLRESLIFTARRLYHRAYWRQWRRKNNNNQNASWVKPKRRRQRPLFRHEYGYTCHADKAEARYRL